MVGDEEKVVVVDFVDVVGVELVVFVDDFGCGCWVFLVVFYEIWSFGEDFIVVGEFEFNVVDCWVYGVEVVCFW